jgi:hypothetical protein
MRTPAGTAHAEPSRTAITRRRVSVSTSAPTRTRRPPANTISINPASPLPLRAMNEGPRQADDQISSRVGQRGERTVETMTIGSDVAGKDPCSPTGLVWSLGSCGLLPATAAFRLPDDGEPKLQGSVNGSVPAMGRGAIRAPATHAMNSEPETPRIRLGLVPVLSGSPRSLGALSGRVVLD